MNKSWNKNKVKRDAAKRKRRKTREPHRIAVKQARTFGKEQAMKEQRTAEMAAMMMKTAKIDGKEEVKA